MRRNVADTPHAILYASTKFFKSASSIALLHSATLGRLGSARTRDTEA